VQLNFLVNNNDSQHVQAVVATVEGEIQALPVVVKVGPACRVDLDFSSGE
jgi:hypothetical protein